MEQVSETISALDVWSRLASDQECVDGLAALAYYLFASGLPRALPEISRLLAPVALGGVDRVGGASSPSCDARTASAAAAGAAGGRAGKEGTGVMGRGGLRGGDVEQQCTALVAFAALARAVSEVAETETLLGVAEVLLPHMVLSSSAGPGQSAPQLPVRVRTCIVASAQVLCHREVMQQCGHRLLHLLVAACSHAAQGAEGFGPDSVASVASAAMSLERSALVAQARARRLQEEEQLGYEAAAALPHCLLAIPRSEARVAAKLVCPLLSGWWTSSDENLRCAAAELAAALARLLQDEDLPPTVCLSSNRAQAGAEMDVGRGEGGGGGARGAEQGAAAGAEVVEEGGGGNGAEHDACTFLRSLGYEMLRELMLGLGDGHLKVRVACKRSTGVLGQVLLGQHADVNTLLKSSAFDERWQTDIPTLMHQWLRLLSIHMPEEVTAYQTLVTQGVSSRRADAVCVVAHIGGSLLRLRIAVAHIARALVLLLGHPESGVRCAAAEALQYFLPPPPTPHPDTPTAARRVPAKVSRHEEEEEAIARRLLELGNQALDTGSFKEAAAQYTRALEGGDISRDTRTTLLSNRSAAYGHLQKWEHALGDACNCHARNSAKSSRL